MYGTPEDEAALRAAGFTVDHKEMTFLRHTADHAHCITAVWGGKRLGDLTVPAPEYVCWVATVSGLSRTGHVVPYADKAQTPLSCYVQAEVRLWEPVETMKAK